MRVIMKATVRAGARTTANNESNTNQRESEPMGEFRETK